MNVIDDKRVAVWRSDGATYPDRVPYHPHEAHPEYPFGERARSSSGNLVYEGVRTIFKNMGLDAHNWGTADWNPLGDFIKPGDKVLLKPNFVKANHRLGDNIYSIITHGSVIRAVLDYVFIALAGRGYVVIGDAPLQSGDFDKTAEITNLKQIKEVYQRFSDFKVDLIDLRKVIAVLDKNGIIKEVKDISGDPLGYAEVNLGSDSLFYEINKEYKRYRVTNYDKKEMLLHHNPTVHEYCIAKTVLTSDVVINLPKLKTHRKGAVTGSLKNAVGINVKKDYLPHHRCGAVREGGDEYRHASFRKRIYTKLQEKSDETKMYALRRVIDFLLRSIRFSSKLVPFKDPFFEGSWHGNDTLWRMVLDLNKILLYADREGVMTNMIQRRHFSLMDAIVAGEKEGPTSPQSKPCGLLIGGFNPVLTDIVAARLMGFDHKKIKLLCQALHQDKYPLCSVQETDIDLSSHHGHWKRLSDIKESEVLKFKPPAGWVGHVELE
jgi:uncharacterized protein (DUF362 family)